MTRADLNAYAAECGVDDPEGYANKEELAAAVEASMGKPAATDDGDSADSGDGDGDASSGDDGDDPGDPNADDTEVPTADRYRVLKAFTLDDGRTVMPGEVFEPADVTPWPARRTKQLTEQKYLRPMD
jgi:hypothetical protein